MDSMSTEEGSNSSPSTSSTSRCKFEVFISFRAEDTLDGFTDHLYAALNQKGILTFGDNKTLERGGSILTENLKVIIESRFVNVVFSKNYAFSTWCLDELVKIIRCRKEMMTNMTILPVFYDVEPSDVRRQGGTFGIAFAEYDERFKDDLEKVQTWRIALLEVANLTGWVVEDG